MTSIQQKGKYFLVKSEYGSFSQNNLYDAERLKKILDNYEILSLKNDRLKKILEELI